MVFQFLEKTSRVNDFRHKLQTLYCTNLLVVVRFLCSGITVIVDRSAKRFFLRKTKEAEKFTSQKADSVGVVALLTFGEKHQRLWTLDWNCQNMGRNLYKTGVQQRGIATCEEEILSPTHNIEWGLKNSTMSSKTPGENDRKTSISTLHNDPPNTEVSTSTKDKGVPHKEPPISAFMSKKMARAHEKNKGSTYEPRVLIVQKRDDSEEAKPFELAPIDGQGRVSKTDVPDRYHPDTPLEDILNDCEYVTVGRAGIADLQGVHINYVVDASRLSPVLLLIPPPPSILPHLLPL